MKGQESWKLYQLQCWLKIITSSCTKIHAKTSTEEERWRRTAFPAPTEHRTDESGEKEQQCTQFWCPRRTFTMLPGRHDGKKFSLAQSSQLTHIGNGQFISFTDRQFRLQAAKWWCHHYVIFLILHAIGEDCLDLVQFCLVLSSTVQPRFPLIQMVHV